MRSGTRITFVSRRLVVSVCLFQERIIKSRGTVEPMGSVQYRAGNDLMDSVGAKQGFWKQMEEGESEEEVRLVGMN